MPPPCCCCSTRGSSRRRAVAARRPRNRPGRSARDRGARPAARDRARGRGARALGSALRAGHPVRPADLRARIPRAVGRGPRASAGRAGRRGPAGRARELPPRDADRGLVHGARRGHHLHGSRARRVVDARGDRVRGRVLRAHVRAVASPQRRDLRDAGDRALGRSRRLYNFRDGVLAIVPRFSTLPLSDNRDRALRARDDVNGLTAMFLGWASDEASGSDERRAGCRCRWTAAARSSTPTARAWRWSDAPPSGSPSTRSARSAVGPALRLRCRRAQVPAGSALGRRAVAAAAGRSRRALDGGGPALVSAGGLAFPHGEDIAVDPGSGEVVVHGGYAPRAAAGSCARRSSASSRHDGHRRDGDGPAGKRAALPGLPAAKLDRSRREALSSCAPRPPLRACRKAPSSTQYGSAFASSNAVGLLGYRRYVTVPAGGRVGWTLAARRLR